jgi:hypothetical protein
VRVSSSSTESTDYDTLSLCRRVSRRIFAFFIFYYYYRSVRYRTCMHRTCRSLPIGTCTGTTVVELEIYEYEARVCVAKCNIITCVFIIFLIIFLH